MSNVDTVHMQTCLSSMGENGMFEPGYVAWCDGDRGVLPNGSLSVFGTNNTDCKLKGKQGQVFPYLKGNNYDEPLGVTTADRIVMGIENGEEVTAQKVLETISERAKKSGFDSVDIKVKEKHPVVVRFMNSFIPLEEKQKNEFLVPTHYSFQTLGNEHPRNLLVSGHKGGIDVQADGMGDNPLYSLEYKEDGTIEKHFYKVEESDHAVGTPQTTSDGKGQSPEIGIKGNGPRGNVFCVMSIPNKNVPNARFTSFTDEVDEEQLPVYRSLGGDEGVATAAVLSVDNESMGYYECHNTNIVYDTSEPIVVTIMYYNTLRNTSSVFGPIKVPLKDIAMAVGDMDKAYDLCLCKGRLSELAVMLKKMTKEDMDVVKRKMVVDPPSSSLPPPFTFKKGAASQFA